jgi:hypothetical protein
MTQLRLPEAARVIGVSTTQLRNDIDAGLLTATRLDAEGTSKLRIYAIDETEVERYRRWRVKYRGAYYPDINVADLTDI